MKPKNCGTVGSRCWKMKWLPSATNALPAHTVNRLGSIVFGMFRGWEENLGVTALIVPKKSSN